MSVRRLAVEAPDQPFPTERRVSLAGFSIRRPVTVIILAVAAVVFGSVALERLAIDLLPDISYPSITVRTELDDAAPQEVETLVTRPVENAVGVVDGVERVRSSSRADVSEVTLEMAWGTEMDLAALDVRERLDVVRLPDEAERPVLLRYDPSLDPILRLGLTGSDDLIRLRRRAEEDVERALERIEGVAAAVVSGGLEEEVQVELDERQISALGLDVQRIVARLAEENVNVTGGRLQEGRTEVLVRTVNEVERPEDLQRIIVATVDGAVVRLEDVARVRRGFREREIVTRIDGRESVEIAVYKEGGTNTVAVSREVRERLEEIRERLEEIDPSLELTLISDQARFIRESITDVLRTAVQGGVLAILVLFLFLRSWKPTLTIGVAIPISVMTTFFLMFVSGVSLNVMSLGGLTLGIGLLVDNAIVVLEAIQRRRDEGDSDRVAADRGTGEVGRAVVASTLTTVCVFVPILFVEGVAGQLFGDQALTVTYSLLASLIVALSVIPMLVSRSRPEEDTSGEDDSPGLGTRVGVATTRAVVFLVRSPFLLVEVLLRPVALVFDRVFEAFRGLYSRSLRATVRRPLPVVLVAIVLLAGSLTLGPGLGSELVPEMAQGELFVDLELPPGTHLDVTSRILARLERRAAELEGVQTVSTIVGTSHEQGGVSGELRENIGQITLFLAQPTTQESELDVMERLRPTLDAEEGLRYRFGRPSFFSFSTPVEVEIRGYNLELLSRLAGRAVDGIRDIPGLADVRASTEGGNPELQVRFDRDRLASFGLGLSEAADRVRTKVQGSIATEIQRPDRAIEIRVRNREADRESVADLLGMAVDHRDGVAIPLSAVATVEEREGPAEIRRSEGDRVAVITANLAGTDLATATAEIEDVLSAISWPSGFDWQVGGQSREMVSSFDSLKLAIGLAIFMVYLVMASQFESLLHPLVILFSVPFAVIGVIATLAVFGVPVSIVVLIGAVLLAGIVVNNAIILVDTAHRLRREGLEKAEALVEAGSVRLRPILMTTATTVLGLLPMALGLGEGSELRRPMALTVIGGLVTSTLLTLIVVPALYSLVDRGRSLVPPDDV